MNNTYSITVHFHKLIEDWDNRKSLRFSSEEIRNFLAKNHLHSHNVSWHCIRQEIEPKVKVNMHCIRHMLIGLFGHCPEAKTHVTVSNRDPIQHTTIHQSRIPCSKFWSCYIFIVLNCWWQNSITAHIYANYYQGIVTRSVKRRSKGYPGLISVMNRDSNSISIVHSNFRREEPLYLFIQALFVSGTDTGCRDLQFSLLWWGKRSSEGFRGIIILLILAKAQSLSLGQALRLGQACQLPGHHSTLL